jgi:hypothetical protein
MRNLPNETPLAAAARVLERESGRPFSSDDLQLVRHEVVSITLSSFEWQEATRLGFLGVYSIAFHSFSFTFYC